MFRRLASIALTLAIALTLVPLFGITARAEADGPNAAIAVDDIGTVSGDAAADLPEDDAVVLDDVALGAVEPAPSEDVGDEASANAVGAGSAPKGQTEALSDLRAAWASYNGVESNAINHSVKITQKGATVTIKGSVSSPYVLGGVIMDDAWVTQDFFGTTVNYTIDMNSGAFATGYHTVVVGIFKSNADGSVETADLIMKKYLVTNLITDRPTYKGSFTVYNTYFDIYPFQMSAFGYTAPELYLEYSGDGGKTWKRSGYMKQNLIEVASSQSYRISGLQPNTTYKTRLRYGEYVTYSKSYDGDGKEYFFGGPVLNSTTITTGAAKKPSIKSVTAKATSVKFHKNRVAGHYEWVGNSLIWIGSYTEKFYTCKIKVTVKLKKKPGTKGLWITLHDGFGQTKWVKGNKKTYTATFKPYPNYFAKKPRGHYKYTVTIQSGQSKNWGGYSPAWSKTKKLK